MPGLYVHIPYCSVKCAYCDFYSGPLHGFDGATYVLATLAELESRRLEVLDSHDKKFDYIYIGGGTPSALSPELLHPYIACADNNAEITVEANPEDVTPEWAGALLHAGVNRVSLGIQSLIDSELAAVGRRHNSDRAVDAVKTLRQAGFTNISLDLMYGLPGQTFDSWCRSLDGVLALSPEHLSAYLLSIEPGTRLHARLLAGKFKESSDELIEQMYDRLCDAAKSAGFEHYEISNFAQPEKRSRHNSAYWDFTPYLGLGPGAHSFDGKTRRFNPGDFKKYMQDPAKAFEVEAAEEHSLHNDRVFTALRTSEGLDPAILTPSELDRARRLLSLTPAGRYRIDESQWLMSNSIISSFMRV